MGYYTKYELETSKHDLDYEKIISDGSGYSDCFDDEIKWYDHDDEMKSVSKLYPDVVFKLYGEGGESGDIWVKYYKGGKVQYSKAKITFDPFDESKLTT